MRPWERAWFQYWQTRNNTRTRKDRQLHHLERIAYFWPMWIYVKWAGRRLKPEQTITAPKGAFFMPENNQEDA